MSLVAERGWIVKHSEFKITLGGREETHDMFVMLEKFDLKTLIGGPRISVTPGILYQVFPREKLTLQNSV